LLTILKAVAGMEINGRHEIAFIPRGTEDTAERGLDGRLEMDGDNCDGEDEESQAFDQLHHVRHGLVEERMSYDDDPAGLYNEECDRCAGNVLGPHREKEKPERTRAAWAASGKHGARRCDARCFPGKTREQLDAVWAQESGLDYPERSIEEKRARR
jgi:hypothetical protein